jgi:hypothetical protein
VKRLDLLPPHLVTLPELAVQRQLLKYSPQKEGNDGLEMHILFTGHIPVDLNALIAVATSYFSVRITKNQCHSRLSDISRRIGS